MGQMVTDYLGRASDSHIDMTEGLRRGTARVLAAQKNGLLLKSGQLHLLSANSAQAAEALCEQHAAGFDVVLAHQEHSVRWLREAADLSGLMACRVVIYRKPPPELPDSGFALQTLGEAWWRQVAGLYEQKSDEALLRAKLCRGLIVGAFDGDKLIGFVGRHSDGSLGMLQVLPDYKRMGVGRLLEICQIRRFMAWGDVPYGHVDVNNAVSLAMQQKLGFDVCEDVVYFCTRP